MWWKADAAGLARVSERISTVYVEKAVVGRNQNGIAIFDKDGGETSLPATTVAALLLGPGTNITHGAMRLLADSGTCVCWVGENGVRFYAHGVSIARTSRYVLRQAWLVSDPRRRVGVARRMYEMRFPGEDVSRLTMQQLRGREGARVKRAYQLNSSRTGVPWTRRSYVPGKAFAAGDDLNRLLSALNACLYGVAHAAITGLGASPAMGFIHTGNAISFVLDVADLYKAVTTIPIAFDLAAEGTTGERDARLRFRDAAREQNLVARAVADVHLLLFGGGEVDTEPANELWGDDDQIGDDGGERIRAGFNHSAHEDDDRDPEPSADWAAWDQPS